MKVAIIGSGTVGKSACFSFLLCSLLKHSSFVMSYLLSFSERLSENSKKSIYTYARVPPWMRC